MSEDNPKNHGTARPDFDSDSQAPGGAINPSAPTTGTEQWGNTSDEKRVLDNHDPQHTRAGQMKGNPGDSQTEASGRASADATTNKRPASKSGDN